jgi:hypothetical protein
MEQFLIVIASLALSIVATAMMLVYSMRVSS